MASTIVTSIPWPTRFSAISSPMNPAPITTALAARMLDVGGEAGGVFDRAQRADSVVAEDGRAHGSGTHAENELVVGDICFFPGERRLGRHCVRHPVDRDDLVVDPNVESKPSNSCSGVCSVRSSSSSISPPTKYGKPQFAKET